MDTKQKLPKRPWWMINGAREPLGSVDFDWIDSEHYRWGFVEDKNPRDEASDSRRDKRR